MSFDVRGGGGGTESSSTGGSISEGFGLGTAAGALVWVIGAAVMFFLGQLGIIGLLSFIIALAPIFGTIATYLSVHTWFFTGLNSGSTADPGALLTVFLLMLIPIFLLFLAGLVAGLGSGSALMGGISVTVGYSLMTTMAILLLIALGYSVGSLDLLLQFVIAGLGFPLLFGTAGGALGSALG